MDNSDSNTAKILVIRTQDGETEKKEYSGIMRTINGKLNLSFSEVQDDGRAVKHLLKIDGYGMEWLRLYDEMKSKTAFRAGQSLPFLFSTSHGALKMKLTTHEYTYTKKDTHEICVSYTLDQDGVAVSKYKTTISIIPSR